jgi:hypothetical protein
MSNTLHLLKSGMRYFTRVSTVRALATTHLNHIECLRYISIILIAPHIAPLVITPPVALRVVPPVVLPRILLRQRKVHDTANF